MAGELLCRLLGGVSEVESSARLDTALGASVASQGIFLFRLLRLPDGCRCLLIESGMVRLVAAPSSCKPSRRMAWLWLLS